MVCDTNMDIDVVLRVCRNKFLNLLIAVLHINYKCIKETRCCY